jgi:hypothetical protein
VLETGATYEEVERSVRAAITDALERAGREVPGFDEKTDLIATGLRSLDFASVIAVLERQWNVDPFLEHRSITEIRTVGDLCIAYKDCLDGVADGKTDSALAKAVGRAVRRKNKNEAGG